MDDYDFLARASLSVTFISQQRHQVQMRATEDDINVFSGEDFFMVLFFSEEDERLSTYNRMGQSTENESSSHSLNARRT